MRKIIIILIIIVAAAGLGAFFKDDAIKLYESASWQISKGVQDFKKTDIGNLITEAGKELITPPPLLTSRSAGADQLFKSKIIAETNVQRQANGLPALKENIKLSEAAAAKAGDMFKNQYFEHNSPSGVDPGKLVQMYGYDYIAAGENLILGNFASEKEIVADWMASPGHRANILKNRYLEIGVAIIKGQYEGRTVWIGVQEFGLPLSTCSEPSVSLKNSIESKKSALNSISSAIDEKRAEIENTGEKTAYYSQLVDDYNKLVAQYNSLAEDIKSLVADYNRQVNIFNQCVAGK